MLLSKPGPNALALKIPFSLPPPSMVAFITRSATKTLDFLIHFLSLDRRHNHTPAAAAAADINSGDQLLSRFLNFFKPNPNPSPSNLQLKPRGVVQYDNLLISFKRSTHPDETLRLFEELKSFDSFKPNLRIYGTVMDALVSLNRFQEAEAVFEETIGSGIIPDVCICTVLLKMYCFHLKNFSWAYGFIRWMIDCGINPNVVTYSTLITGLCRAGRIDEAYHVLVHEMRRSGCDPDHSCYGAVFDALVSAGRYKEVEGLFGEMMGLGENPDVVLCHNLVKMYCFDLKRFDSAREVIRWMGRVGCKPDVVVYSILVDGLCQEGKVAEAKEVVDEMLKEKCTSNCRTFTPILQFYCSKGKIEEAKRLLDWMESVDCYPDTVCYNVFIHGLCEKGYFDQVENVLRESLSKGWDPDAVSYNTYINALCKVGRTEEAFRQLEVMFGSGLCPTVVTLNIFLDRLCRESGVWKVKHLLEGSSELGLDVDVISYNTVMSRLCEVEEWFTVLKLFTDMMKKGIEPDTWSVNIVIYSLCKAGKFRKAKCIFHSKGFAPDVVSCNILMHQYLLAGNINELNVLLSYMKTNNIAPDKVTCNIQIDSFCREGKFSEAIHFCKSLEDMYSQELIAHLTQGLVKGGRLGDLLRLFEELLDKGLVLDCQVYDFLITAFCKKGSCNSTEIYKLPSGSFFTTEDSFTKLLTIHDMKCWNKILFIVGVILIKW